MTTRKTTQIPPAPEGAHPHVGEVKGANDDAKRLVEQIVKAGTVGGGERAFAGWKARLNYQAEGIAVQTDIRYQKIEANDIATIVRRGPFGGLVHGKYGERHFWETIPAENATEVATSLGLKILDATGFVHEIKESEQQYFQVLPDGSERAVDEFERTKEIVAEKLVDRVQLEQFLIEAYYEIWAESPGALLDVAEHLAEKDQMIVTTFTFGGWKIQRGLIYPVFQDNRFVLIMALTTSRRQYRHLMPMERGAQRSLQAPKTQNKPVVQLVEI